MNRYIDSEKLIAEIKALKLRKGSLPLENTEITEAYMARGVQFTCDDIVHIIQNLQQEQPEENKLPNKRTRVNYAICKLQSFKPLREAIVLDDYVYDEDKCYRENLLNYIHAIPESRLTEIRSYLKEKGWWPYDDDADWEEQPHKSFCEENCKGYRDTGGKCFFGFNCSAKKAQEQPEVDLEKEMDKFYGMYRDETGKTYAIEDDEPCFDWKEDELSESDMRFARHFYELGLKARKLET